MEAIDVIVIAIISAILTGFIYYRKNNRIIKIQRRYMELVHQSPEDAEKSLELQPRLNLTPGIFTLETDLERDVEVTLLAMLITLTPGSVVLEISPDHKCLYIHGMDLPESIDSVNKSKLRFEDKIRQVTRK